MNIFHLRKTASNLHRLQFILGVLFKAGAAPLIRRLKLQHLVPLQCPDHSDVGDASSESAAKGEADSSLVRRFGLRAF